MKIFRPSLDRLADLAREASREPQSLAVLSDEFSRILHDLSIRGVWRWTERHRLKGVDQLLSEHVVAQGLNQLRMLDVGASDGITSLDTIDFFRRRLNIPVSVTIMDRHIQLFSVKRRKSVLYFTSAHCPVLIRSGRFALCLEPMEGFEGVAFNKLASSLARRYAGLLEGEDLGASRPISLINPAVSRCPAIEVCERDLFDPEPAWFGVYDTVRASNVLNLSYYSERRIQQAIAVLYQYLKEGGVLLVSRNQIGGNDEKEKGGLWQKKGLGFARISRLAELPEIAGSIDQFRFA